MNFSWCLLISVFLTSVHAIVHYKLCHEYTYAIEAKTSLHGNQDILLKARVSFEVLPNTTNTELLLHFRNSWMQYGEEQVNLGQVMNLGQWFSIGIAADGEVRRVQFPSTEVFDVVHLKKTVVSYISGKFKSLAEDDVYDVQEAGPEGLHDARYKRRETSLDVIYEKRKNHSDTFGHHAQISSMKTTVISSELGVPRKIMMHDEIKSFHRVPHGFEVKRPPLMGPNGKLVIDPPPPGMQDLPGISMTGSGTAELVDMGDLPCRHQEPPQNLITTTLEVQINDQVRSALGKEDVSGNSQEIFEQLDGNLSCVALNRKRDMPVERDCFINIMKILRKIPEENLPDVGYAFFTDKQSPTFEEDKLTMIDAFASLQTPSAQMVIYEYFLNNTEGYTQELLHRIVSHFISYRDPLPLPVIVDKIVELALHTPLNLEGLSKLQAQTEVDYQHGIVLVCGAIAKQMYHHGNETEKQKALEIVGKLEAIVGIHDPYHWHMHRQRRSTEDYHDLVMERSVYVEALGNAGLERSIDHVISHLNHSDTPYQLKRTAIHAIRRYNTEEVVTHLLEIALFDEEVSLRYEALKMYHNHPRAGNFYKLVHELEEGFRNGSLPRCPKPVPGESSSVSLPHLERVRRSVWKGIRFKLATPSVDWAKQYGNDKIGASMGLRIRNELEIDIKLHKGRVRIDIDDQAYALCHIGLIGVRLDILDAKVCLIGGVEYEMNLLQEFGFDSIKDLVNFWDRFQNGVVRNIRQAVERFRVFLSGAKDFTHTIKNLDTILSEIPSKVRNLRQIAIKAMQRIGEIDPDEIPPFAQPLLRVFHRIIRLYTDIKTDVMNFYNTLVDTIKVQIPSSWRQIREGVFLIGQSIKNLFKSPKESIAGIFKAVFKIKLGVEGLQDARNRTIESCFFLKDKKPYWWDLTVEIKQIREELRGALATFNKGIGPFLKARISNAELEMRKEFKGVMLEIYDELMQPLDTLRKLAFPLVDGVRFFTTAVQDVKTAYIELRDA